MPPPSLHRILSGAQPDVRISTLEKLAGAVGVRPGELLGDGR